MVKVFFESKGHADLVAIFDTEELYMACLPILEYQAKENRMIVTESIEATDLFDIESEERTKVKTPPFITHNDNVVNCGGTSLVGYITVSYEKLVNTFGEPNNSDGYKVDAEWDIKFADGTIATIYNWKNGKNYIGCDGTDVEEITDWHIGGVNELSKIKVEEILGLI